MGKSSALWERELLLGGAAIAVLALLLNSNMWDGGASTTLPESTLSDKISSRDIKSQVCLNMIANMIAKTFGARSQSCRSSH